MTKNLTPEMETLLKKWPKLLYSQCEALVGGDSVMIADINIFVKRLLEAKDAQLADAVEKERCQCSQIESELRRILNIAQDNLINPEIQNAATAIIAESQQVHISLEMQRLRAENQYLHNIIKTNG